MSASATNKNPSLLVVGGARSGKSGFAQAQAEAAAGAGKLQPVFVATAQPHDEEMRVRIARHAAARGSRWRTLEAPFDLVGVLSEEADRNRLLLVDCLTLWLSNLLLRGDDVEKAIGALARAAGDLAGPAIYVTNEVGCGIVPDSVLGRRFRDAQGTLNQAMGQTCDNVVLVAAGLPTLLKPKGQPPFTFQT